MFGAVFKGLGITYFMQKISVRPTPDIDLLKIKGAKLELLKKPTNKRKMGLNYRKHRGLCKLTDIMPWCVFCGMLFEKIS